MNGGRDTREDDNRGCGTRESRGDDLRRRRARIEYRQRPVPVSTVPLHEGHTSRLQGGPDVPVPRLVRPTADMPSEAREAFDGFSDRHMASYRAEATPAAVRSTCPRHARLRHGGNSNINARGHGGGRPGIGVDFGVPRAARPACRRCVGVTTLTGLAGAFMLPRGTAEKVRDAVAAGEQRRLDGLRLGPAG
jgi:hypothetical protein